MSKITKDDAFFMVFVGGKPEAPEPEAPSVLLGLVAIALVMMVLVGLLNDSDRRRQDVQSSTSANCFFTRSADDIFQPCPRN